MKFLRRKAQATETVWEEGRVVHREIQISVEREWIAVPTAGGSTETAVDGNKPPVPQAPETKVIEAQIQDSSKQNKPQSQLSSSPKHLQKQTGREVLGKVTLVDQ